MPNWCGVRTGNQIGNMSCELHEGHEGEHATLLGSQRPMYWSEPDVWCLTCNRRVVNCKCDAKVVLSKLLAKMRDGTATGSQRGLANRIEKLVAKIEKG